MGMKRPLGLIGVGKMGEALVRGLLSSKHFAANKIIVNDKDPSRLRYMEERYRVIAEKSSKGLIQKVDVCILATKPQDMDEVLEEIKDRVSDRILLISIAAGITTDWIRSRVGPKTRIIRAMPNAPALVGMGATGLFLGGTVSSEEGDTAKSIFDCVGKTTLVSKEDHLNIVTGLSGSGPAYVFLLLEALIDAGVYLGLSREISTLLSLQTVQGSAEMASKIEKSVSLLKEIITSPGGTTAAGLKWLEEGKLRATVLSAVEAATERSRQLAR